MPTASDSTTVPHVDSSLFLPLRGALGGLLMGLANLVPGISGGTMLLAAGVYPEFIGAIAELSTLRFRSRSILLLGSVVAMAALAILLFAGPTKNLVVEHRWVMYSLFIGLTLGGIPIVWRLARPASAGVIAGALVGLLVMALLAWSEPTGSAGSGPGVALLFVGGIAGASAMILPGVSGGYLLLLLGLYVPILGAVDDFKNALTSSPRDFALAFEAMKVGIPVGLGVVLGVVGVSNLLKLLLERFRKPTLGALIGLLLGAVIGLWPFQEPVPPAAGSVVKGVVVSAENVHEIDLEDWPTKRFSPTGAQVASSVGLVLAGIGVTQLIGRLGRRDRDDM